MSVKSDTWIRRMALEQRMIEPFVDGQVREGVIDVYKRQQPRMRSISSAGSSASSQ